jgi:hypothetical protein
MFFKIVVIDVDAVDSVFGILFSIDAILVVENKIVLEIALPIIDVVAEVMLRPIR